MATVVVTALLFFASAALTAWWCAAMSTMGGMPMPGGWTMSMTWMRMPDQTWPGAAASFVGMWIVMMVAMMLPALLPVLRRYRKSVGTAVGAPGGLTTLVGAGYFVAWTACGAAVYPVGAALAGLAMHAPAVSRAVPAAIGAIVVVAGALQFTRWKARRLACCRNAPAHEGAVPRDAGSAWRLGLRVGLQCIACCANLMAILLVSGIMDLRTMILVTAAITAERVAPAGEWPARAIGIVVVVAGMLLVVDRVFDA
jgi:predicted metal-binding membrane protein